MEYSRSLPWQQVARRKAGTGMVQGSLIWVWLIWLMLALGMLALPLGEAPAADVATTPGQARGAARIEMRDGGRIPGLELGV